MNYHVDMLSLGENRDVFDFNRTLLNSGEYKPDIKINDLLRTTINDLGIMTHRFPQDKFSFADAYILTKPLIQPEQIYQQQTIQYLAGKRQQLEHLVNLNESLLEERATLERSYNSADNLWIQLDYLDHISSLVTTLDELSSERKTQPLEELNNYIKAIREDNDYAFIPECLHANKHYHKCTMTFEVTRDKIPFNVRFGSYSGKGMKPLLGIAKKINDRFNFSRKLSIRAQPIVSHTLKEYIEYMDEKVVQLVNITLDIGFYKRAADYIEHLEPCNIIYPTFSDTTNIVDVVNPLTKVPEKLVPNSFSNQTSRTHLITGANNGGKTVYAKTIGVAHLLAQRGFPIPAASAVIQPVDQVLTHFVSPDDPIRKQGRYKNELERMKRIFEQATSRTLTIVDEPCGGTDPFEGETQSAHFLEALVESGMQSIFTTHYHSVAKTNVANQKIEQIHPEVTHLEGEFKYTHKILKGPGDQSYASEIAKLLGVGQSELLEMARRIRESL